MTTKEMIEVMQAFDSGRPVEYCSKDHPLPEWYPCPTPNWGWNLYKYRVVAPKPAVLPDDVYKAIAAGYCLHYGKHAGIPGYYAVFMCDKGVDWDFRGHGDTPQEAIKNAISRLPSSVVYF